MNNPAFQKEFSTGMVPAELNGFYTGSLAMLFPRSFGEMFGSFFAEMYLPWSGKFFYGGHGMGDNILPSYLVPLLRFMFRDVHTKGADDGLFHAFPFKTSILHGLHDPIPVLQLNYDLIQNPPLVRSVIDEIVWVGEGKYLGKAHLKEKNSYRLVAYFRLSDPSVGTQISGPTMSHQPQ